ncbi:ABC transporter permease [Saccharicrinis sp. FJH2]|uniref:ABC transporter permease n=1 Tax=Saccharicrinis sp. FJH65 TaxID=3344659 RepID=UPI0035F3A63B
MVSNHIKTSLRSIAKNPVFSIINLLGLAVGIICVILTSIWVSYELGYDGFNKNNDRIYKVSQGENFSIVPPLFNSVKNEFPEIEKIVRTSTDAEGYMNNIDDNDAIKVKNVLYTNSDFGDIFTCNTICGNLKTALDAPNSIVLTKELALKIFGKTDVEGKTIHYVATFPSKELTLSVKSVVADFPSNSNLKFDAIIPFATLNTIKPNGMMPDENWRDGYCNMYLLLKKGTNENAFVSKLAEFGTNVEQYVYGLDPKSPEAAKRKLGLVKITDLHFYNNSRKQLVGYISIIGLLIILIAIVNYINLSIAKLFSVYQGLFIRKINGASRYKLVSYILIESVLYSFAALLVALLLIMAGKPLISGMLHINFALNYIKHPGAIFFLILSSVIVGIIAGLYPALKLTSNISANTTKVSLPKKDRNFTRQSLVIFQFTISIALIISVFVIAKQINFLNNKDLGFDNHQIIYAQLNKNLYRPYNEFKQKLLKNPNIKSVSGSQCELGQYCVTLTRDINGTSRYFQELPADPDFIETMGLELVQGRNFSWDMSTDRYQTVILSESAVKAFGLDSSNVIGTEVFMYDRVAKVVGVIKDFYFQSFHHKLDPFMLYYHPGSIGTANIKISGNNVPETMKYISKVWNEFSPDVPFEYHFLDKKYEELYEQDRQFSQIITSFLFVAIVIACLGLFGLVSFTTIQRTKEIGIRKVNGAKVSEVLVMLNKDFVTWVTIAFVIATPIALYAMNKWLESFAYKTTLSWWIFALSGLLALGIALLTVSFQSWKAATRNPVEALRYE